MKPGPYGLSGRDCGSKKINTSVPFGIDILTQTNISGERVMTVAVDFFPPVTRRLHTLG